MIKDYVNNNINAHVM